MAKKVSTTKKKTTKKTATEKTALTVAGGNDLETIEASGLGDVALFDDSESWGAGFDLDENADLYKNDLLIPKVWLAQKMSKFLGGKENITPGDYVDSLTLRRVATCEEGLNFVVVKSFKKWQAFSFDEKGKKVYEKDYSATMTTKNADWKYEETVDGKDIVRSQVNSFIVLLERDLIANNPQGYCVDFTRSSRQGGRKLVTSLKTNTSKIFENGEKKFKLPASAFVYSMTAFEHEFDEGATFCKDITYKGLSNKAAVKMARDVYEFVKNNESEIEYDERDVLDENKAHVAPTHETTVTGTSDI